MYYNVPNLLTLPSVPLFPALYGCLLYRPDVTGFVSLHGVNGVGRCVCF